MAPFDPDEQSRNALNRGAGAYSTPGVDTREPERPFTPRTAAPQVIFQLHGIAPPSMLYMAAEDVLFLRALTGSTGQTLQCQGRWMRPDGVVVPFQYQLVLPSNRTTVGLTMALGEGYLLSACVTIITPGSALTQTFALLFLQRPGPSAAGFVQLLTAGTLRVNGFLTYPGGRADLPTDGKGYMRSVQQANPGAGADWTMVVPTNARWRLNSLNAQLATAVAAATRIPQFIIDDGVNILYAVEPVTGEIASSTEQYSLGPGASTTDGAGTASVLPAPDGIYLFGGWRIRTVTAAIQAADQWSNIFASVEEWIDMG